MTTAEFMQVLDESPAANLTFHVPEGRTVPSGYHITEIMNVQIDSVDCGGRSDSYTRQVAQLWNGSGAGEMLTTGKVRRIFQRVDSVRPLLSDSELFFEWGDDRTQTATWAIERVHLAERSVEVHLAVTLPTCKPALESSSACCGGKTERSGGARACC